MGRRRLVALALLAAGGLVVGASGLILLVLSGDRAQPNQARVEAPVVVTAGAGAAATIEAHSTPSLSVDPADPRHILLAERIDRPRFNCGLHGSRDGGATWTPVTVPIPQGVDNCYIPDVAFAGPSVLAVYLTLNTHPRDPLSGGNDPNGMYLVRSDDGGLTFGAPVALPGKDNLQPRITADRAGATVHVVYLDGHPYQNETPLGFGPVPYHVMVITSTDGGHTFGSPVQVNDPARPRVGAATPLVVPGGDLLVLYEDYKEDWDDYNNRATPYHGTHALMLARSSDGGRTFSQTVVDDAQVRSHRFLVYTPPFPSLAASPDGRRLYAAWSDGRRGAPDVLLRRSDDGGKTWAAPIQVNHRASGPASYELPVVVVEASRTLVAYYAFTGTHPRAQVQLSYSTDGGGSFVAPAALSRSFDATVGVPSTRLFGSVDFGSHLAAVAAGRAGSALFAWADSGLGTRDTGRTDIVVAQVTVP